MIDVLSRLAAEREMRGEAPGPIAGRPVEQTGGIRFMRDVGGQALAWSAGTPEARHRAMREDIRQVGAGEVPVGAHKISMQEEDKLLAEADQETQDEWDEAMNTIGKMRTRGHPEWRLQQVRRSAERRLRSGAARAAVAETKRKEDRAFAFKIAQLKATSFQEVMRDLPSALRLVSDLAKGARQQQLDEADQALFSEIMSGVIAEVGADNTGSPEFWELVGERVIISGKLSAEAKGILGTLLARKGTMPE